MSNYILIDGSYFVFYRYYALMQWWKNAKPDDDLGNPIENELFVTKFKETFIKKIKELPKKLKIKDPIIYVGKDCPREKIWRMKLFPDYKKNRVHDDSFMGGPFFKMTYEEKLFEQAGAKKVLKCKQLEADDCVALTIKHLLKENPLNQITIIASDHDYLQLMSNYVNIYNLKYKNLSTFYCPIQTG